MILDDIGYTACLHLKPKCLQASFLNHAKPLFVQRRLSIGHSQSCAVEQSMEILASMSILIDYMGLY